MIFNPVVQGGGSGGLPVVREAASFKEFMDACQDGKRIFISILGANSGMYYVTFDFTVGVQMKQTVFQHAYGSQPEFQITGGITMGVLIIFVKISASSEFTQLFMCTDLSGNTEPTVDNDDFKIKYYIIE